MVKKNIVLSLEARMTSSRLPNKIFKKINNLKVIEILIKRIKKIKSIDNFFVAISFTGITIDIVSICPNVRSN